MTRFAYPCSLFALLAFLPAGAQAQGAPKVPDTVVFETGVEYSNPDGQHLQLNIARPKSGDGPFPAIVCIHGGGFRAGKRESYDGLVLRLAERGYVALTVTYRLAPKYPFPAAVHDTKAAVRWLRAASPEEVSREQIRCEALAYGVDAEGADRVIARLEAGGILRLIRTGDRRPGRPARRWAVNPALTE